MAAARAERYESVAHDRQTVIVIRLELRTGERRHVDDAEVRDEHRLKQLAPQIILRRPSAQAIDPSKWQITYPFGHGRIRSITVLLQALAHFAPEIIRRFS